LNKFIKIRCVLLDTEPASLNIGPRSRDSLRRLRRGVRLFFSSAGDLISRTPELYQAYLLEDFDPPPARGDATDRPAGASCCRYSSQDCGGVVVGDSTTFDSEAY